MKKITKILGFILASVISLGAVSAPAFAIDACGSDVPPAIREANDCNNERDELKDVVGKILNSIIYVLGFVAVVFIIYGGVQYMTSAGDSGKTAKAKNTLLYAAIGLIVCVLAFAIVNFVINILG